MKLRSLVAVILGGLLFLLGAASVVTGGWFGIVPLAIGASLAVLGWRGGRHALAIFGHTCIVVGCFLITWGIYLLPHSQPTVAGVFTRPLFWGLFSLLGGVCANYHAFCNCIRRDRKESQACPGC